MKIHHIGYAVKSIEKSLSEFESLGYESGKVIKDSIRNVEIVFLHNDSGCIELVAPCGEPSDVEGPLKKGGVAPYHICYETDNLEDAISELKSRKGWILIKKPEIAPAIKNNRVAFLYHKDVGIIELVELKEGDV